MGRGRATRRTFVAGATASFAALPARAAGFPDRPLRMIVPSSPGSATDTVARIVGPRMAEVLGVPIVPDNQDGAANIVGMSQLARAPKDGYTIGLTTSVHVMNPYFYKVPYDPIGDFAPVSLLTSGTGILAVPPASPITSLAGLLALAKQHEGADRLTYGSPGVGTPLHLAAALLFSMAGVKLLHIPYNKSYTQYLVDLMAGRLDVAFVAEGAGMPLIASGRLRALAVSTPARNNLLPDVPTAAEAGVPGYSSVSWFALVAPAGVPDQVVEVLNAATRRALEAPDTSAALIKLGYEITPSSAENAAATFRTDYAKYGALVRTLNKTG